jgi:selenocysteine-specific elongation factor
MHVIATAGHVDHGKSTLVRALTGMEPDRWAEERRRGMTIDLGYAWTQLPSGAEVAFVDVPGHQKFVTNMLAGVGPAPAAMIVIAADEGWRQQTQEHVDALLALNIRHGLVVVTRSDLADPTPVRLDVAQRLAGTCLGGVETVVVSGHTGAGVDDLRAALDRVVARLPAPDREARVRLWIDRAFTIRGRGTVVTGTLAAGAIHVGDELALGARRLSVRGLQALARPADEIGAVARVAVNLRGIGADDISRGDTLLTPSAWHLTDTVDVALTGGSSADDAGELTWHIGAAAVPARVRPLGPGFARVVLSRALPLTRGDRAILRDPGRHEITAGALVLDADPPAFTRRGAARARADALGRGEAGRLADEVRRRGVVTRATLNLVGVDTGDVSAVRTVGRWLIDPERWSRWVDVLPELVDTHADADPRRPGLPIGAAARRLDAPDVELVGPLAVEAGLVVADGQLNRPGAVVTLGAAEPALRRLEARWRDHPFAAPDQPELTELGLTRRDVAAAEKLGRLMRIGGVILAPGAADHAVERLRALPQPFTVSQARLALDTTRRVAVPLLEHLDATGRTERVGDTGRRLRNR